MGAVWVLFTVLGCSVIAGCSSSSAPGTASGGAGATGGSVAATTGGDAAATSGGTATSGGGAATGGGGSSHAGTGGAQTGLAGSGGAPPAPGADCAYTDNSSSLNAIAESSCDTGYCLWDGRYFGESYCTVACSASGAGCPSGYECDADQGTSGKSWCARTKPVAPSDLGAACASQYLEDCSGPNPLQNFCLAPAVDSCENEYCVYDGISQNAYCSTACRGQTAPCPDSWDCWRNPSGITGVADACVKHHDPAELVGLSCYHGTPYNCPSGMPCYTEEAGTVPSCAPQGGACIYDLRSGVQAQEYCSMRCESAACPNGYECVSLPIGVSSAMYCVQQL